MSVIAEFVVGAGGFPMGNDVLYECGWAFELERIIPTEDRTLPFYWVTGIDGDRNVSRYVASVEADPEVESLTLLDRVDDRALFRAVWRLGAGGLIEGLTDPDLVVLELSGDHTGSRLGLRAERRSSLARFREYCRAHSFDVELTRVGELTGFRPPDRGPELSVKQREALETAYELGYFDEPRRAQLAAVGDALGISRQAAGARIRRGTRRLVEASLGRV
jgi:predicted DNA binding protein